MGGELRALVAEGPVSLLSPVRQRSPRSAGETLIWSDTRVNGCAGAGHFSDDAILMVDVVQVPRVESETCQLFPGFAGSLTHEAELHNDHSQSVTGTLTETVHCFVNGFETTSASQVTTNYDLQPGVNDRSFSVTGGTAVLCGVGFPGLPIETEYELRFVPDAGSDCVGTEAHYRSLERVACQ